MSQQKDLLNEADVGSGERTQGQKETDKMIEKVPDKKSGKDASTTRDSSEVTEHTDSQSGNPP
jgi:hypothetical protein